jgi:hypothetical protein
VFLRQTNQRKMIYENRTAVYRNQRAPIWQGFVVGRGNPANHAISRPGLRTPGAPVDGSILGLDRSGLG